MKHQGYRLLCSSLGEDLAKKGPEGPKHIQTPLDLIDGLGLGPRFCLELICGQRLLAMMCWRAAYSAVRTCDRIRKGARMVLKAPALATMKTDNLAVTTRSASLSKTALEEAG